MFPVRLLRAVAIAIFATLLWPVTAQEAQAEESSPEDWEFVVAPYLLLPSIDGRTTTGRVGGDIAVDPGGIFSSLQFGGMLHAEARHGSGAGVMVDSAFMFLGDGATGRRGIGRLDADVFQGIFEVYGTYRFDLEDTKIDPYEGARIWHIDTEINLRAGSLAGRFDSGDTWLDPVVGLRVQHRLSPSWRVQAQGDVGGFGIGVASEFTWNVMGGIAYDGWEQTSLFLMYRVLGVDFDSGTRGTSSFFEYDTITQGPLLGVGYRF
ncbi:MAG: hypothetical protein AAFU49_15875 [Pseudomonadota bacterium]